MSNDQKDGVQPVTTPVLGKGNSILLASRRSYKAVELYCPQRKKYCPQRISCTLSERCPTKGISETARRGYWTIEQREIDKVPSGTVYRLLPKQPDSNRTQYIKNKPDSYYSKRCTFIKFEIWHALRFSYPHRSLLMNYLLKLDNSSYNSNVLLGYSDVQLQIGAKG